MENQSNIRVLATSRRQRLGRADGSSMPGVYQATWTDEDFGRRSVTVVAGSSDEVLDLMSRLTHSTVLVSGPVVP